MNEADSIAGRVDPGLLEELPGLKLRHLTVERGSGKSPRGLKERLKILSDRFAGPQAITMRNRPIPWAYRVFYRHIGLDPDEQRTEVEQLALERMLKIKCAAELGLRGLDPSRPYFMQFKMKADEETFFEVLAAEAEKDFDPIDLVYPGEVPYFDRYDEFVPEELVRKGFAEGVLDIEDMKQRVLGWRDHA